MLAKLADLIPASSVSSWLLIAFLVFYFIYKEWPDFRKRVSSGAVKEQKDELTNKTVEERLTNLEEEVKEVSVKLERDYQRLNQLSMDLDRAKGNQGDMAEELGVIMEALMAALGGLQELGANGSTKEARAKLQDYLNRKAHAHVYAKEDAAS